LDLSFALKVGGSINTSLTERAQMKDPNQRKSTLTKSLMISALWVSLNLIRVFLLPLAGIYAWIYLIPVLFPILKGPLPNREPKTFHQVVMEAKKREAERLRWNEELDRRAHGNYSGAPKKKPPSLKTAKE